MKKVLSLVLCLAMVFSLSVTAFAENTSYDKGEGAQTAVSYEGTGTEAYTVTVPATITVKDTGDKATGEVNVAGTWASNKHLTVTCPTTVTLTNDINSADTKTLNITFAGIDKTGNNCVAIETTDDGAHATLTVDNIKEALFGDWTGSISYTVTMANVASN